MTTSIRHAIPACTALLPALLALLAVPAQAQERTAKSVPAQAQERTAPPAPVRAEAPALPAPPVVAPPRAMRAPSMSVQRGPVEVPPPAPMPEPPRPAAIAIDTVARGARPAPPPPEVVAAPARPRVPGAPAAALVRDPEVRPPAGATRRCGDGTFVVGRSDTASCAARGGTAVVLPVEGPPPLPSPPRAPRTRRP